MPWGVCVRDCALFEERIAAVERCQSGVSTPISFEENADSKSAVHTSQASVSGAAE